MRKEYVVNTTVKIISKTYSDALDKIINLLKNEKGLKIIKCEYLSATKKG